MNNTDCSVTMKSSAVNHWLLAKDDTPSVAFPLQTVTLKFQNDQHAGSRLVKIMW